jgi:hypothetical protein
VPTVTVRFPPGFRLENYGSCVPGVSTYGETDARRALQSVHAGVRGFTRDYREHSTSWELEGVADGGRTLEISSVGGKCDSGRRTETTETPTVVRVEVIVEVPAQASCEDIAVYRTVEVELARPLGDRQLLDARTGRVPEFFSRS